MTFNKLQIELNVKALKRNFLCLVLTAKHFSPIIGGWGGSGKGNSYNLEFISGKYWLSEKNRHLISIMLVSRITQNVLPLESNLLFLGSILIW